MSLEDAILKLTAAVEANTAALKGSAGSTKASAPAAAPTPAPTPAPAAAKEYVGQHTKDEMKAMVTKVKEKHGVPAAKAIIKTDGGADKLDDINDPKTIDHVYQVAKAKYEEDGI